jgi:hypothetical protein
MHPSIKKYSDIKKKLKKATIKQLKYLIEGCEIRQDIDKQNCLYYNNLRMLCKQELGTRRK